MLNKIKLNLYSNKYKIVNNFLTKNEVDYFYNSVQKEIQSLQRDYFPNMEFSDYFNKMFQHLFNLS